MARRRVEVEDDDDDTDDTDDLIKVEESSQLDGFIESVKSLPLAVKIGGVVGILYLLASRNSSSGGSMSTGAVDRGFFNVSDDRINSAMSTLRANAPDRARVFLDVVERVAREERVYPGLIYGMMQTESNFNPNATGDFDSDGVPKAHGLIQINDNSWNNWSYDNDWSDPYTNLKFGIGTVLRQSNAYARSQGFGDDVAVAGYNAGPSRAVKGAREGNAEKYTYQGGYLTGSNGVYTHMRAIGVL